MSTQQYLLEPASSGPEARARLSYVTVAQYSPEWNSTPHAHACAELFFITSGQGRFWLQQRDFPVQAGELVVVNPNVLHTELGQPGGSLNYLVLGVEGLDVSADDTGCCVFHLGSDQEEIFTPLRLLAHEARRSLPGSTAACQALLQVLLLRLARLPGFTLSDEPLVARGPKVNQECDLVRRYIDTHFKENLSLDQLAAQAHLNKYYLAHSFRREFGVPPISYLISRRIQESQFLLRETDHSLSQIAQILGFSSLSYFSQCFRRQVGLSPLEYRKRQRAASLPPAGAGKGSPAP